MNQFNYLLHLTCCFLLLNFPVGSQEHGESQQADPHERSLPTTLDDRLVARVKELMGQGSISDFTSLVRIFASKGIDDRNAASLLFHSVACSDDIYILILAKEGVFDINAVDEAGNSAFANIFSIPSVTGRERLNRLELLLDLGYRIRDGEFLVLSAGYNAVEFFNYADNLKDFDFNADVVYSGTTPLISAIRFGSLEAVRALLSRGADPMFKDSSGKSALDYLEDNWPKNNIPHLSLDRIRERQELIRKAVQGK